MAMNGTSGQRDLRTGVDLVEIPRFTLALKRSGQGFLERVFQASELAEAQRTGTTQIPDLAIRFALKESLIKALGGLPSGGLFREIVTAARSNGRWELELFGRTAEYGAALGLDAIYASAASAGELIVAWVVIEGARGSV